MIYNKLKAVRGLLGLSQSEIASQSGIAQKDISLLESGAKKFIPNEYIQYLYNSGVDINSIFDDSSPALLVKSAYTPIDNGSKHIVSEPKTTYNASPTRHENASPTASPTQKLAPTLGKILSPNLSPTDNNAPATNDESAPASAPAKQVLVPQIITVDRLGNENILHVNAKAAAGYLKGYGDREYIESLQSFSLPGLADGTFRSFEVEGDSMHPTLRSGQMVIGRWVEKFDYIRDDRVYIIVHKTRGITVKRLLNRIDQRNVIVAKSDATNERELYRNFDIAPDEIQELWYAVFHGGFDFQSPSDMWKRLNNVEADLTSVMQLLKNNNLIA